MHPSPAANHGPLCAPLSIFHVFANESLVGHMSSSPTLLLLVYTQQRIKRFTALHMLAMNMHRAYPTDSSDFCSVFAAYFRYLHANLDF